MMMIVSCAGGLRAAGISKACFQKLLHAMVDARKRGPRPQRIGRPDAPRLRAFV